VLSCALTQLDHPWLFQRLIAEHADAVGVVTIRNLVVLAAAGAAIVGLVRASRSDLGSKPGSDPVCCYPDT
jgi:hypothetical protein